MQVVKDVTSGTVHGVWNAVQSPFEDIGVKRQPIPEILQKVSLNPYGLPAPLQCSVIQGEIRDLNEVLGPDVDAVSVIVKSRKDEYIEKGAGMAQDQASGMAYSRVNIIPYRGVVRQISGANKHAKKVAKAYEAGKLRRAFLKGLASALTCG